MRWVFIRPLNRSPYYDPEIQEPLGIEALGAARRRAGDEVLLLDGALDGLDDRQLGRRTAAFDPDVVGFSLTTGQDVASVRAIHREIGRMRRACVPLWVAGGNFVSTEPDRAAELLPTEMILVRFEGEVAIEGLARERLRAPDRPRVAPGVSRRRIVPGPAVPVLDALPFPMRAYASRILGCGWAFNLQASRGCRGACRYCSSPGMRGVGGGRWRGRSAAHVADEVEMLARTYGAASFNFVDEDFLGPPADAARRARAFADEIRRRRLNVAFSIQARPASLGAEAIEVLADVGLVFVFVGIESDNREDFRRWGRSWTGSPWRVVRRLQRRGVTVNAGTLMFHPHATLAGVRRFATRLHTHGLLDYRTARNRLDAMPGSALHRQGLEEGALSPSRVGPQPLPFRDASVGRLYDDVLAALEPLGPPSMQALCALPPLLAQRRLSAWADTRCVELTQIAKAMDAAVARSLFALLEAHECGEAPAGVVGALRTANLAEALRGARALADRRFVPSFRVLREAIRTDAGV
jgi:hypothetical protein